MEPLTLREDPTALAPETLLVFELSGPLITFARAVEVIGLRFVARNPAVLRNEMQRNRKPDNTTLPFPIWRPFSNFYLY